jgi:hypothetical protein
VLAALALAAVVTAIAVPAAQPAAAASAPWHGPNPSIAVDNYSDQFVFWKGTDGGLWEAYNDGSWHGPIGLHQMGILGSPPSVAVSSTQTTNNGLPYQYVVWEGTDRNLWLAYWDGSWHGPAKIGFGPLGSQPSVSVNR